MPRLDCEACKKLEIPWILLARTAWCCSVVIGWMTAGPRVIFAEPRPHSRVRARLLPLLHLSDIHSTVNSSRRNAHQLILSISIVLSCIGGAARVHGTGRRCSPVTLNGLLVQPKSWTHDGRTEISMVFYKNQILYQFRMVLPWALAAMSTK
jgi:hypothetical protein